MFSFSRGPTRRKTFWAGALFTFLACLFFGVFLIGNSLYEYPANPSSLPDSGAIVCLAGGKHRIEAAYSLFAEGIGSQLWIVGAGKKSTVMGLARAQAVDVAQKIPWDRIDKIQVETDSRNTIENAFAVKRLLDQNPSVKEIVLITSPYHMRRAMLMIEHQIPAGVHLIPYTPSIIEFGRNDWWKSWTGINLTIEEAFKFKLASVLVPRLGYF